jgi:hypothetical protein
MVDISGNIHYQNRQRKEEELFQCGKIIKLAQRIVRPYISPCREHKNRAYSHKRKDNRFDGQRQPVICCGDGFRHSYMAYVGKMYAVPVKKDLALYKGHSTGDLMCSYAAWFGFS